MKVTSMRKKAKKMFWIRENLAILSSILIVQVAMVIATFFVWNFLSAFLLVSFFIVDFAGWWSSRKLGANVWKLALMEKFRMYTVAYIEYYDQAPEFDSEYQDLKEWEKSHVIQAQYFMSAQEAETETGHDVSDIQEQIWRNSRPGESYYFRHANIIEVLPWWIPNHVIPYFTVTLLLSIPATILGYLILVFHESYNSEGYKREIGLSQIIMDSRQPQIVPVTIDDLPDEYIVAPRSDNYGP